MSRPASPDPIRESLGAPAANPVLVEVTRGAAVENRHRGAVAVVDAGGQTIHAWGDVSRPIYPRSSIKALQALALLESGAAEAFGVSDSELALVCASHNGEPRHVEIAGAWLARLGLGADDLACGPQPPRGPKGGPGAAALAKAGGKPTRLHNNCSGKHAGMLCLARHLGAPTKGYERLDHPVQQLIRTILSEMTGVDHAAAPVGIDGCGLPTYAAPLAGIARGLARLAAPDGLPSARAAAARRLRKAVAAEPFLVAGTARCCTSVMDVAGAAAFVKVGAEGVYVAALPGLGLGLALKIDDGAVRAAEVALIALLRYLGVLDEAGRKRLASFAEPEITNWAGLATGFMRAAPGWPE